MSAERHVLPAPATCALCGEWATCTLPTGREVCARHLAWSVSDGGGKILARCLARERQARTLSHGEAPGRSLSRLIRKGFVTTSNPDRTGLVSLTEIGRAIALAREVYTDQRPPRRAPADPKEKV